MSFLDFQKNLLNTSDEHYYDLAKKSNITPEIINESIDRIEEWFSKQPHLVNVKLDDEIVRKALKNNDWSVKRTKEKLNNYYILKSRAPHLFKDRDTLGSEWEETCEHYCILPKMTSDDTRISILGFICDDPSIFNPIALGKFIYALGDLRNKIDNNYSDSIIVDGTHMTMGHLAKMGTLITDVILVVQGAYSVKVHSIHILNFPSFGYKMFQLIKPLFKSKITDRILFHQNLDELHKYISPELLPSDYNGHQASKREITQNWKNAISSEEIRNWMLEQTKYKSDESLRNNNIAIDVNYGTVGTFRTLNID